jgi:uncharacterized protein (TIGR02145 family)
MPKGKDVTHEKWSNEVVLFDDGCYSAVWGNYENSPEKNLGVRWNKKTLFLMLVLLTTGIGHANLGNFCSENQILCYSLNANNKVVATMKAEITTIKADFSMPKENFMFSFAGTYASSGDKIAIKITDAADKNAFLTYIKKWQLQNYDIAIMTGCEGLINRRMYPGTPAGVQKCAMDMENRQDSKLAKQQINARKVGDDIYNKTLEEFIKDIAGEFALVENSLHRLDEHCQSTKVFTKPDAKPSSFKLYCSGNLLKKKEEFVDSRDGKKYIYVTIGNQTWMAENLNYHGKDGYLGLCKDKKPENCEKEGRLYDWAEAMGIDRKYNENKWGKNPKAHQGICPEGWSLPGDKEWKTLLAFAGGEEAAGKKLRLAENNASCKYETEDDRGRITKHNECATNEYGFSGIGYWWSTEEVSEYRAEAWGIEYKGEETIWKESHKFSKSSADRGEPPEKRKMSPIRCVKNIAIKAGLADSSISANVSAEGGLSGSTLKTLASISLIGGGLSTLIYGYTQDNKISSSIKQRDGKAAVKARDSRNMGYGIGAGLLIVGLGVVIIF